MSTQRATSWSLTLNNPTSADEECINLARQNGWKVEGQLEKGKEGTPHYQLLLQTPQVRFSAVKKMFPRAHIEVARNVSALKSYVHKEETREGELPTQQEMYPSLSRFWTLLFDEFIESGSIIVDRKGLISWAPHSSDELTELDWACESLIRKGYVVETLGVNPQNRTAFKKYSIALMIRVQKQTLELHRQTDRQTALENQDLIVPTEHTPDALCSPSSHASPSSCSQDVSSSSQVHSEGDSP